jgi:hypothetical protein
MTKATEPGERMHLDTTGPFAPSIVGTTYDVKLVDQFSRKTWGTRACKKKQVPDIVAQHLTALKGQGITEKFLRCDNA